MPESMGDHQKTGSSGLGFTARGGCWGGSAWWAAWTEPSRGSSICRHAKKWARAAPKGSSYSDGEDLEFDRPFNAGSVTCQLSLTLGKVTKLLWAHLLTGDDGGYYQYLPPRIARTITPGNVCKISYTGCTAHYSALLPSPFLCPQQDLWWDVFFSPGSPA